MRYSRQLLSFALCCASAFGEDLASARIHGSVAEVKDAVVHRLIPKGWSVAREDTYKLVLMKPTEGAMYFATGALLGNRNSDRPNEVLTFDLAPGNDAVVVNMRESISVQFNDGETRDTPVKNKRILQQQREFLSSLQMTLDAQPVSYTPIDVPAPTATAMANVGAALGLDFESGDLPKAKSLSKGGAAELGGVAVGDLIFEFDGKQVASISSVTELMATLHAGDTVQISVLRESHIQNLVVILAPAKTVASALVK